MRVVKLKRVKGIDIYMDSDFFYVEYHLYYSDYLEWADEHSSQNIGSTGNDTAEISCRYMTFRIIRYA
jgi:hypothetical protein